VLLCQLSVRVLVSLLVWPVRLTGVGRFQGWEPVGDKTWLTKWGCCVVNTSKLAQWESPNLTLCPSNWAPHEWLRLLPASLGRLLSTGQTATEPEPAASRQTPLAYYTLPRLTYSLLSPSILITSLPSTEP
jgi:hypothetical protein